MNTVPEKSLRAKQDSEPVWSGTDENSTLVRPSRSSGPSPWRRRFFRCVRLLIACGLIYGVYTIARQNISNPTSDIAYLNADIISLRAPVGGELQLADAKVGTLIPAGQRLFFVKNERTANQQALAYVDAAREAVDRLGTERAEADVTAATEKEILKHYENLYARKSASEVAVLEHQQKASIAETIRNFKQQHLDLAEQRAAEWTRLASMQNQAEVCMPFDGVVWSIREQNGSQIGELEKVVDVINPKRIWVDAYLPEKQAGNFQMDTRVVVRTVDGKEEWKGHVASVRAGVGRVSFENYVVALPPDSASRRRIAVRIELDSPNPFSASEFFGIGRSVVVSLEQK